MKSNKTALSTAMIYALAGGCAIPHTKQGAGMSFIKDTGKPAPKAKPKFKRSKKRGW